MRVKLLYRAELVRLILLSVVLAIVTGSQILQSRFINRDLILSIYIVLGMAYFFHLIYILGNFSEDSKMQKAISVVDIFLASALIYFTGLSQTLFVFMYLVSIILAGFVFQFTGAMYAALLSSILFTSISVLGPEVTNSSFIFIVVINNIAFFAVATLSGYMSEQLEVTGQDLKVLRNLNQIILDNMPTGLVTTNEVGVIVKSNVVSELLLRSKMKNQSVLAVLPEIKNKFDPTEYSIPNRFEIELERGDGAKVLAINVAPLVEKGTGAKGHIFILEDLTAMKKLEFAMKQREKLAAVGQLAAGLAHEIRNPLASISGSIELMSQSMVDETEKRLMNIVLKETKRLNNLISEFLDFARPEKALEDRINITSLVKEVLDVIKLNDNLRSDVEVKAQLSIDYYIKGNKDKLKQAFLNVIINSYQAMAESTKAELKVVVEGVDSRVILNISDTGCGMNEENRRRMFEPFHTTKVKGTGLGLAITHKILENHGAKIWVTSDLGKGTQFTIDLPQIK